MVADLLCPCCLEWKCLRFWFAPAKPHWSSPLTALLLPPGVCCVLQGQDCQRLLPTQPVPDVVSRLCCGGCRRGSQWEEQAELGACGASLSSPGRLLLSGVTGAGSRQTVNGTGQFCHHLVPTPPLPDVAWRLCCGGCRRGSQWEEQAARPCGCCSGQG